MHDLHYAEQNGRLVASAKQYYRDRVAAETTDARVSDGAIGNAADVRQTRYLETRRLEILEKTGNAGTNLTKPEASKEACTGPISGRDADAPTPGRVGASVVSLEGRAWSVSESNR